MMIVRPDVSAWERVRTLRLAALADAPDAFGSTLAEERDQPDAFWRRRLLRADATTLIVVHEGRDAGIAVVAPEDDDASVAGIFSVWVAPFARGRGADDALIAAAIDDARARGFRRVVLEVGEHNVVAQALYARHGFTPSGLRGHLPAPREHVPEIQLVKQLRPRPPVNP
jgi:ribosomal protein S18 acetylase RimI-like enzyme